MLLRAAVTEGARLERVRLVGDDGAGKFGMDAADLVDAARLAARSEHLELLGLHAFGASNVLEAGALVAHAATTARAARELARLSGTTVRIVDAGGGLGIPYEPHEDSLDLVGLGSRPGRHRRRLGRRPVARRGAAAARARALPGRAGRRLPGHASWTRRRSMGRRSRSSMAGSITSCGRRWSGRSIVSGCSVRSTRRPVPGDGGRTAVLGAGCPRDGRGHGPAIGRRPGRRAGRRRLRLHGVDAPTSCRTRSRPRSSRATGARSSSGRELEPVTWLDAQLVPDLGAPATARRPGRLADIVCMHRR